MDDVRSLSRCKIGQKSEVVCGIVRDTMCTEVRSRIFARTFRGWAKTWPISEARLARANLHRYWVYQPRTSAHVRLPGKIHLAVESVLHLVESVI